MTTENIYSCLVKHTADGIIVCDSNEVITYCNPAFANIIGLSAESLVGEHLSKVVDCNYSKTDSTAHDTTSSDTDQKTHSQDLHNATIICKNGSDLSMPVNHIAVSNAEFTGCITIVYIIQSSSVQQAQTEFVSTVSHELRTPLTSIKGFADTILRAGERLDTSQQRRYVGIIKDQADRLTRLVEDLLAVSRLESKKLQLTIRAIDLADAIQRVCRNLGDKASNHQIVNKVPPGLPPVWADADRLEQILTNLLDNAIKYSPVSTTVTITAKNIDKQPEFVEFAVMDEGIGIAEEHLPEIFNKFSRLENPLIRQNEGTGLGLYITKSLILALGGQIRVESGSSGTKFSVLLPAATLEEQAARGRG